MATRIASVLNAIMRQNQEMGARLVAASQLPQLLAGLGIEVSKPSVGALVAMVAAGALDPREAVSMAVQVRNYAIQAQVAKLQLAQRLLDLRKQEELQGIQIAREFQSYADQAISSWFKPKYDYIRRRIDLLLGDEKLTTKVLENALEWQFGVKGLREMSIKEEVRGPISSVLRKLDAGRRLQLEALVQTYAMTKNAEEYAKQMLLKDLAEASPDQRAKVALNYGAYAMNALSQVWDKATKTGYIYAALGVPKNVTIEEARILGGTVLRTLSEVYGMDFGQRYAKYFTQLDDLTGSANGDGTPYILPPLKLQEGLQQLPKSDKATLDMALEMTSEVAPAQTPEGNAWNAMRHLEILSTKSRFAELVRNAAYKMSSGGAAVRELVNLSGMEATK